MNSPESNRVKENCRVTVVIPTYKRADILPHLLSALKRQTYQNFDLVVVVKPSEDGTEETSKARIKHAQNQHGNPNSRSHCRRLFFRSQTLHGRHSGFA